MLHPRVRAAQDGDDRLTGAQHEDEVVRAAERGRRQRLADREEGREVEGRGLVAQAAEGPDESLAPEAQGQALDTPAAAMDIGRVQRQAALSVGRGEERLGGVGRQEGSRSWRGGLGTGRKARASSQAGSRPDSARAAVERR